jgi:hypothetical protein
MSDTQAYLFFLVFLGAQAASMKKRWSIALLRGEGWFLGIAVPPGFHAGPGRALLRTFRLWLLAPYALEFVPIALILRFGRPADLMKLAMAMVVVVVLNSIAATRTIQKRTRAYEVAGAVRPAASVTLSLKPRRFSDYTRPGFEITLAILNLASLASLVWTYRTAEWEPTLPAVFARPLLLIYLQIGMLLAKRALVGWRTVVPRENAETYLEWREYSRRYWIGVCDTVRIIMAMPLAMVAIQLRIAAPWEDHPINRIGFAVSFLMALVWMFWYWRHRDRYLSRAAHVLPVRLPLSLEGERGPALPVCYRPQHPVLLLKGDRGYSLNVASARAQVGLLYLAGLATLYLWLHR